MAKVKSAKGHTDESGGETINKTDCSGDDNRHGSGAHAPKPSSEPIWAPSPPQPLCVVVANADNAMGRRRAGQYSRIRGMDRKR